MSNGAAAATTNMCLLLSAREQLDFVVAPEEISPSKAATALRPSEIVVAMEYSCAQPLDMEMFRGKLGDPSTPKVLGCDGVGKVLKSGNEDMYPVGCLVAFVYRNLGEDSGSWQNEVLLNTEESACVVRVPVDVTPQIVAAGLTSTFVAVACLRHFKAGDTIVMAPAFGGVGICLIQQALLRKVRVVALGRGSERGIWLCEHYGKLGGLSVIDVTEDDWTNLLYTLCGTDALDPESGADGMIDGCGGDLLPTAAQAVKAKGMLISFGSCTGEVDQAALDAVIEQKQLHVARESAQRAMASSDAAAFLSSSLSLMVEGKYIPHCWQMGDWRNARECLVPQRLGSRFPSLCNGGSKIGRIILKMTKCSDG
mmetsp:Transcript_9816/g.14411  ORF Transcript_9816/g.14411 Transcript_9816/m.14411 type:complete len:368 (+) Transcript_9816:26-1129(+)